MLRQVVWYAICLAEDPTAKGFETRRRMFEVERTGEWTRGMCVVDRRSVLASLLLSSAASAFLSQSSAANARTFLPSLVPSGTTEVPLEIRSKSGIHGDVPVAAVSADQGVEVVVKTPGTEAFGKMFLERVYGVKA